MESGKKSIGKAVASGTAWMFLLRLSIRGIGLISTLILARLLLPEDFGLVAIAMSFVGLIELISTFGFDWALIQRQNTLREHYDTAFTFNVIFGAVACLATLVISFPVAHLYGNPDLMPLIMACSLMFLLNGFQNIGVVKFRKDMAFDKEFRFKMVPKIVSFFCTILLAFWLRNFWSLVIGSLIWKGVTTVMSYIVQDYRPTLSLSKRRELFGFSKWLMINNFLQFINLRSPEMIIGKLISSRETGLYSVSKEASSIPTSELVASVNVAAYSGYSKVSADKVRLKKLYCGILSSISLYIYPSGIGLAMIADYFVPVLLGRQWMETIILIKYLSIAEMIYSINSNSGYIFISLGKPKINSYMSLVRLCIFLPLLIYFSLKFGLLGAVQAILITAVIMTVFYNILVAYKLELKLFEIIELHWRPLVSSILMVVIFWKAKPILEALLENSKIVLLVFSVLMGAAVYSISVFLLWYASNKPDGLEKKIFTFIGNSVKKRFGPFM